MKILLTVVLAVMMAPPQAQREESREHTGKGEIGGRITDKDSGLALAGVRVHLRREGDTTTSYEARTDERGLYRFTALPAGRYRGSLMPPAFRASYLWESLPDPSGRPEILLKDGEVRGDVNGALPKGSSIPVRVVDERGEPLSRIHVRVKPVDTARDVYVPSQRTTDDRGRVRAYPLPPGRYLVCAEVDALGASGGTRRSPREQFRPTCYPSAADEALAQPVRVTAGDNGELEITMRRGRAITVSGTLTDAAGSPVSGQYPLSLSRQWQNGSSSRSVALDAGGRFRINDVAPGDYALEASVGGPDRPEQRRELEIAFVPLRVDESDIEDVFVRMTKGVTVHGRITFEDASTPRPRLPGSAGLTIASRLAADRLVGSGSMRTTMARDDGGFTLDGIFGRRIFDVFNVPRGWYVKAMRYGDKDATVAAVDVAGASVLDVILSQRGAVITGRASGETEGPVRGTRVIVFPADPALWGVRELGTAAVSATGDFKLGPLRGGDYFVAAVAPGTQPPGPWEGARLARFADVADRVSLNDEEQRTLDLRIVRLK